MTLMTDFIRSEYLTVVEYNEDIKSKIKLKEGRNIRRMGKYPTLGNQFVDRGGVDSKVVKTMASSWLVNNMWNGIYSTISVTFNLFIWDWTLMTTKRKSFLCI